jgi:small-conductance mechanosensitive channel
MENWVSTLVNSGLIVGAAALGVIALHLLARRVLAWMRGVDHIPEARRQQLTTLLQATQWIINVLVVVSALLMLLSELGLNIAPLLASVGVAGLAVSLGAQTFIKDVVGGILILLENQYAVGDSIAVGNVWGRVERITLRTTQVRALNGDLYFVPNGEVRVLANMTRDWSRVLVDLGIAYEEDLDRALGILSESAAAFGRDPAFEPDLLEAPQVLGVNSLGDSAAIVRVAVKTRPGQQWTTGRALRKYLLAACEREGVNLPYPRQEILLRTGAAPDGPGLEG